MLMFNHADFVADARLGMELVATDRLRLGGRWESRQCQGRPDRYEG
jgi:hypothetical protein